MLRTICPISAHVATAIFTPASSSTGAHLARNFHASGTASEEQEPQKAASQDLAQASPTGSLLDLFATRPRLSGPEAAATSSTAKKQQKQQEEHEPPVEHDVLRMVLQAVENCKPLMKVQSIKTGTKIIHVPKVVTPEEQRSQSVKWIMAAVNQRKESSGSTSMAECLATELLLAYKKSGAARQKRDDVHKLAFENKNNVAGYSVK